MAARYATSTFTIGLTLAAPSGLGVSPNVGGGTFGAATYYWVLTNTNAAGETTVSNEVSTAVAASGTASLTWSAAPAGTSNQKLYRGTSAGAENVLVATLAAGATSYTDTGTAGTSASPPASNSAVKASHLVLEGSLRDSAHPAVTANPSAFSVSAPVAGAGHVTGELFGRLAAYPAGTEL